MEIPEDIRKLIEERIKENPAILEKYGNPLDPNNPQFWPPTERQSRGLSVEDRLHYLESDVEASTKVLGEIVFWKMDEQQRRMRERIEAAKTDPKKAMELLNEIMGSELPDAAMTDDNGNALAGSIRNMPPDALIDTPQGVIRKDQIPGFRDDPDWMPSPDWIDSNCMCPSHQAMRNANERTSQKYDLPGDGPTGFYL